ncbi:MAG: DUF2958 domain-containing protein [Proteobacteria bacterium]|nr:DUF2958 domain-containing protein [Pseudomonadota bacterium]MBU1389720.1 DUF2958 domain-containing protein [Pseudomonadota bacterium]MBU1542658.1 DUF2958 domain-containing protein [Pseudomonadota bacterium]MBU2430676.1 DUF2958 domain-containing protein [Pseudomonadota bacterium]MBU2480729.1 DUF2958 domain-containing protein [Pseudomonadota bacterium]
MFNQPTKAQLAIIPSLYSTEGVPTKDKIIHAHFHLQDSHWFIAEIRDDLMFGFCILNGNIDMAEWGYVCLEDLKSINIHGIFQVEYDVSWVPKPAGQIELIREGGGIFEDIDSATDKAF